MKQVPDTTEVKIDPVTNTLIRDGVPAIINPDDKCGIEAALEIKERVPGTTVTVITMGIPAAEIALREALAMGCDEAVLLTDRKLGGADTWATSSAIAGAVKKLGADLVICGRQAIDGDTAQVGVQIAIHLDLPVTTYVEKLVDVNETSITVQRQYEDRYQTVRMNYPCLITAIGDLNQPRYMSVGGCFDAYQKEIKIMTYADIADVVDESNVGLAGSPTYVATSTTKEAKGAGEMLKDLSADKAKVEAKIAELGQDVTVEDNSKSITNPKTGAVVDVVNVKYIYHKQLRMTRPAFGGNIIATIACLQHRPQMATVRPGVMQALAADDSRKGEVIKLDIKPTNNVEVLETVKSAKTSKDITEAKILVSAGRGIGSAEKVAMVQDLADALGGDIACSRAVIDAGWMDKDRQVGQTGKTVRPELYVACGISGAIQHAAGMEGSDYIIAINKEETAPIFDIADLGIIGDVNAILPKLTEAIKKYKAEQAGK